MKLSDSAIDRLVWAGLIGLIFLLIGLSLPTWTNTHDHTTYTYRWANGVRYSTFTVCGDSSFVNSQGDHWNFIPSKLKPFMKPEFEVK